MAERRSGQGMGIESEIFWYAFVTKPRHEKKVRYYLESAGIPQFLPLRTTLRQWKDRRRWVDVPLFSCYIFVKYAFNRRWDVLKVPGVVRIVSFSDKPAPIHEGEIQTIMKLISTEVDVQVCNGLLPGMDVKITSGPLAGLNGRLLEQRGSHRFVIQVPVIGKSILVDVNENCIDPIETR